MKTLLKVICIILPALYGINIQAITLDNSIVRSDSCVNIQWVADSSNTDPLWYLTNGAKCTGLDSIYRQCDFQPGQTYFGVAYSYGGEDPWYLFRTRLLEGYLVGSHLCHYNYYGDPSNRVTGTDCSGFLSFLWDYPRVNTRIFATSADFLSINYSEIRAGDALVKSGSHIVFILEADTITEVVISEASSTVRGCRERVVDLTDPEWIGYKAIRYPGLKTSHVSTKSKEIEKNLLVLVTTKGHQAIRFHKPFSGVLRVISIDGKQLINSSVRNRKTLPIKICGKSVAVIYTKDELGNIEVNKIPLCR